MHSIPHHRFFAMLLLTAHVSLVVLNTFHIHEACVASAPAGISNHTPHAAGMHGHSVADCPLRLFFSNPILPAGGSLVEFQLFDSGAPLSGLAHAEVDTPCSLLPSLRAPPTI